MAGRLRDVEGRDSDLGKLRLLSTGAAMDYLLHVPATGRQPFQSVTIPYTQLLAGHGQSAQLSSPDTSG